MARECETCAFMHKLRSPDEPEDAVHHLCEMARGAIRVHYDEEGNCEVEFNCHESMIPCKHWKKAKGIELKQEEWVYRYMVRNRELARRKK